MRSKTSLPLKPWEQYMDKSQDPAHQIPRLALNCREAAEALGISERTLWQHAREGRIPHVRFGVRRVFPIRVLEEWLWGAAKTEAFAEDSGDMGDCNRG